MEFAPAAALGLMRARFVRQLESEIDCALCRRTGRSWHSVTSSSSTPSDCSKRAPRHAPRASSEKRHRLDPSDRPADCACLARLSRCVQKSTCTDQLGRTVSRACATLRVGISVISGDMIRPEVRRRGDLRQRFDRLTLPHRSIGSLAISTSLSESGPFSRLVYRRQRVIDSDVLLNLIDARRATHRAVISVPRLRAAST
jgi:hypothetical protein